MDTKIKLPILTLMSFWLCACPQNGTPTSNSVTPVSTVRRATPSRPSRAPLPTAVATPLPETPILLEQRSTPQPKAVPAGATVFRQLTGSKNPTNQTTLRGSVWALDGTKYDTDIRVTVTREEDTLEASVSSGIYQFDALGALVGNVKVTANRYNHAPRSQTVSLEPGFDYVLNFGEPDQETHMYGLTTFPEIVETKPGFEAQGVPGDIVNIVLELSKPLPASSIEHLAAAVRLLPGNPVATGNGTAAPELTSARPELLQQPASATLADFPYSISFFEWHQVGEESKLLPQSQYQAVSGYTLDPSQRKLTVTFPAPLVNGKTPARYQLALAADPERPIKDEEGNVLGTDATGKLGTVPPERQFIQNAFLTPLWSAADFKKEDLNTRWASTHVHASAFTLAPDDTPPTLRTFKVDVRDVDTPNVPGQRAGTTFELQFNEPLLPLMGRQISSQVNVVKDLKNYTFAVSSNLEYLSTTTLLKGVSGEDSPPLEVGTGTKNFGAAGTNQLGKEFQLVDPEGKIKVEFINASVVQIFVPNSELFDREQATAIAVRVSGLRDAAGNPISPEEANQRERQLKTTITYPTL